MFRIGRKQIHFDQPDGGTGGGEHTPAPQSNPADDRIAGLEARLGRLTQALTSVVQSSEQSKQTSMRQQELQNAQGFVNEAQAKMTAASTKLQAAVEAGDAAAIAAATAAVSSAAAEHTAARMHAQTVHNNASRPPEPQRQQQTQQQIDDSNLREWRSRNAEWYGINGEMTREALNVAKQVESEGVLEVGSKPYFQAIDARLRTKYADAMPRNAAATTTPAPRGQMSSNPPAQQSRIAASVADGYRRMGINVDNPEVAKQMQAARQHAVEKGFLPAQPVSGGVITR